VATKNMDWRSTQSRMCSVISSKTFATAGTVLAVLAADAQAFEVVGHRGARGLRPENTISAFQTGVHVGATTVEADVTLTRDQHVIVRHDPAVNSLLCTGPNQGYLYRDLTLRQVLKLDCGTRHADDWLARRQTPVPGSHVPTLGQVYRATPNRVRVIVEPKTDPYHPGRTFGPRRVARRVVDAIRAAHGGWRTTVQSFDWRVLLAVQRIAPRLRLQALANDETAYRGSAWLGGVRLTSAPFRYGLPTAADHAGFAALGLPLEKVSDELVYSAHHRGLKVLTYTLDARPRMEAALDLGVDGIITDFPGRLRNALRR
jgi:glycerophosphoryl diester phosphodiesterase